MWSTPPLQQRPFRTLLRASSFLLTCGLLTTCSPPPPTDGIRFEVSFPETLTREAQDGRLILIVSNREGEEPRFQYRIYDPATQLGFGLDVEGLGPGEAAIVDRETFGFPIRSLIDLPSGDYRVQAVLNRY